MSLAIWRPFGCRIFKEIPRLPAFLLLNWPPISESPPPGNGPVPASRAARPPTGAIAASRVSGLSFHSTLKLSAPIAARKRVPPAEARNQAKSRIFTPCSGNGLLCSAESLGFATTRGSAGTLGRRLASARTDAVSSPSNGARRPTCQLVLVLSHLLVG